MPRKEKLKIRPGRDGIWAAIRTMKTFYLADILERCDCGKDQARGYLNALAQAGYVEALPRPDCGAAYAFRLIRDCGVHAPQIDRDGNPLPINGRQRMWMAMKALKTFSYRDLSLAAQVSDVDAKFYTRWLLRAGYLSVTNRKWQTKDTMTFVPSRDTGPKPPKIRKDKAVYDRNLNKIIWSPERDRRAA